MFTGIVEEIGRVLKVEKNQTNIHFTIATSFVDELKVDQSVSHNGVCLTVAKKDDKCYEVVAVQETLNKSNLGDLKEGSLVNVERCLRMNGRVDGHFVQGHVDATAEVDYIKDQNGSWEFGFTFPDKYDHLIVDKGSVCINGVSLTVVSPDEGKFSVAIIPYTYDNTNFRVLSVGDRVNIEFDILGKYIARQLSLTNSQSTS